ncbi:LamG domain-containing protein [Patescibacteria group bacterium]|nr:LamG domain-containing protein [Patescibacteria group bacterium]
MKFKRGALQPDPSLAGLWHLDGNSKDSSGRGNNGTDTSVTYGTAYGKFGQGAYYNGSANTAVTENSSLALSNITVNAWSLSTASAYTPLLRRGKAVTFSHGYALNIGAVVSNKYQVYLGTGVDNNLPTTQSADGKWHMITMTYDGTTLKAYVDGVLNATSTISTPISYASGESLTIGADFVNSPAYYYNGDLDDVSIFSRALSAPEIAQMYTAGMTKHTTGTNFARRVLAFLAITINFSEAINNSDTLLRGIYKTFTEAITNTDTFQSLKVLFTQFMEAVQSTDTLLRTIGKNFSEAITNSDILLRGIFKSFSEAVTNSDTFSQLRIFAINFIEMVQNTDWLFLNGQLVDRWIRRVKGAVSWAKRTMGSIV